MRHRPVAHCALTLLILAIALALPLGAQPPAPAPQLPARAIDRLFEETMKAWRIPGAAVAIVRDDKVVHARGYGIREIGKSDPVTADTLFAIASTSKAFTSAAVAILVDEKKLSWDDPLRRHLPWFRASEACAERAITLRDALSHRSGMPRRDELWDNTSLTREQVIRAAGELKMQRGVRAAHQYNNIMYIAAGEAVAAASGVSWDEFVRTRLFVPLGMTRSTTRMAEFLAAEHATGHRYERSSDAPVVFPAVDDENLGPAGAIKSSARDLAQWIRFQLGQGTFEGKQIVSADALGETKLAQSAIRFDESSKETNPMTNLQSYGLGWNVQDYRGELLISHGGALNGFRTQLNLLPARKAGFVVLINEGRGLATVALRNALADLLLGAPARDWSTYYLGVERKADEKDEVRKRDRESKRKRDTKPTKELAAYAGTYSHPAYGKATVAIENDVPIFRWQRMVVPFNHYHYDTFLAVSDDAGVDELVTFHLGTDGEVKTLTLFDEEWKKE